MRLLGVRGHGLVRTSLAWGLLCGCAPGDASDLFGGGQGGDASGGSAATGGTGNTGTGGTGGEPVTRPDGCEAIDPEGVGLREVETLDGETIEVYCDHGWALVLSSVGGTDGETTAFWNIPYDARFEPKGTPGPSEDYYDPRVYRLGVEYRDVLEDLNGGVVEAFSASATGIDETTMQFIGPVHLAGDATLYATQFASGWSAPDYDGDSTDGNCAETFANVTQHYGGCFEYSLGADGDNPVEDAGWGPHMLTSRAQGMGLEVETTGAYTRLGAIRRWARW